MSTDQQGATPELVALRQEMLSYDSCLISDACERLGLNPGLTGIERRSTQKRTFGPVVTVRLVTHDGTVAKRHLGSAAVDAAVPGDVIVIEHLSRADCAGWGGLLSTAAKAKGVAGIVIDGLARDIDESEDLGMPVYARGVTPVTARNRVSEVSTNEPVTIGGIKVSPGDYVLADGSGVAFIPRDRLVDVVDTARKLIAAENGIRAMLERGIPISVAMNETYETLLGTAKK
ncbi:RraA family protein [Ensifer sp. ENS05]|uniref:RraA family protein n=1 Tax=Ensifer sp. ENS05 TaxID=2769277 RepID=UPI0017841687|nr:RraA family protein [Ensifer sp. ENS05]MBD9596409.1 RraA family protein [Ensifer sp. ENS05]